MKKIDYILFCLVFVGVLTSCNGKKTEMSFSKNDENLLEETSIQSENSSIKYDSSLASSGWVALYDKKKGKRCYMSNDDYYAIRYPGSSDRFIDGYDYLIPLGIVLKFSGAKIIWGFEGVELVSWYDAKEYAESYSPDGHKWRLLSRVEASAIKTNAIYFKQYFSDYYPNDISYFSYGTIRNWTSAVSDEVNVKGNRKAYTLYIRDEVSSKIEKCYSVGGNDVYNVYPISSL